MCDNFTWSSSVIIEVLNAPGVSVFDEEPSRHVVVEIRHIVHKHTSARGSMSVSWRNTERVQHLDNHTRASYLAQTCRLQ